MFDRDRFTQDCLDAIRETDSHIAVKELIERACSDPADLLRGLGEPTKAGPDKIYVSDELTILNLVWGPYMTLLPHNHNMWAVIGLYTGAEDNVFWKKVEGEPGHSRIEAAGAKAMRPGDVAPLGKDIVHSVTNPVDKLTGALHVYGGNFFEMHRSEWEAESLTERPYDVARNMGLFETYNQKLQAAE